MKGLLAATVRRQPPSAFAFVMATGIVAAGFDDVDQPAVARVLLGLAAAALVVLAIGFTWRVATDRVAVRRDLLNPRTCFGFFTIVAALNVVGTGFATTNLTVTWVLGALSLLVWLLLAYGLPALMMLGQSQTLRGLPTGAAAQADGSWFLLVVATQSLSLVAVALAQRWLAGPAGHVPGAARLLVDASVGLWGIGVLLYILLTTVVTLRLLTGAGEDHGIVPANWIYMGATAITVLAGSQILALPSTESLIALTTPVVSGLSYLLWAFGMWWVPLLVIFEFWRHVIRRERWRYIAGLWSIVFPLGMYSVASCHFGRQVNLGLVATIGLWTTWVAAAVWCTVTLAMVVAAVGGVRRWRRLPPAAR